MPSCPDLGPLLRITARTAVFFLLAYALAALRPAHGDGLRARRGAANRAKFLVDDPDDEALDPLPSLTLAAASAADGTAASAGQPAASHRSRFVTLGLATGYQPADLCLFMASWRISESAHSRLVVFVSAGSQAAFRLAYPGVAFRGVHTAAAGPGGFWPEVHRFEVYEEYLAPRVTSGALRGVLLTDLRDAAFNPGAGPLWEHPSAQGALERGALVYVLEGGMGPRGKPRLVRLGAEPTNAAWLTACFGPAGLAALAARPTSCAGTTYGAAAALLAYVRAMRAGLGAARRAGKADCNDQALHNGLVHGLGQARAWARVHGARLSAVPGPPGASAVYTATFGLPMHMDAYGTITVVRAGGPGVGTADLHAVHPGAATYPSAYTGGGAPQPVVHVPVLVHQADRHAGLWGALRGAWGCMNASVY